MQKMKIHPFIQNLFKIDSHTKKKVLLEDQYLPQGAP